MENVVLSVLAGRVDEVRKAIAKLDKKAARYSVPFSATIGPVHQEARWLESEFDGRPAKKVMVDVRDVTITGETPKVGEYEFIAAVEFTEIGNFVDTPPGVAVPAEYRNTDDRCEHCCHNRNRKHVFVVRSLTDGTYIQVGRTCLRDFLGIDDPKNIIGAFNFWRTLWTGESDLDSFGTAERIESLETFLAKTNALIRLYGWASKGQAKSDPMLIATVERLFGTYGNDDASRAARRELQEELRDSDATLAQEVITWVRASTDDGDYFHNLRVAFADDLVYGDQRTALAISAVSSYHKELARIEAAKVNKDSKHQGAVKERLKSLLLTITLVKDMGDNGYGSCELIKLADDNGNLFAWFTGSRPRFDIGDKIVADATVKSHREFNGILETQLTRLVVQEVLNV